MGANKSLIPSGLQNGFLQLLAPLIRFLARWNVNPNTISIWGVGIACAGAGAFMSGYLRLGGLLILLGGVCDALDGGLARLTERVTRFGALFDSSIDRYAEMIMFFGMAAHFVRSQEYITGIGIFLALCGSIMVSYVRARAEGLGFECKVGIMQRQERVLFIGLGGLIHPLLLKTVIWLIALGANYTAFQRLRHIYRQTENGSATNPKTGQREFQYED